MKRAIRDVVHGRVVVDARRMWNMRDGPRIWWKRAQGAAAGFFLPSGYPASVTPDYLPHQLWTVVKSTSSSATYVLSTAALLQAVGLSASAALPVSAVANWVLRDGLGSAGVMLVASRFGKAMDSHLKSSRWLSECAMVIGTMMEMMTPWLPPVGFLPFASVANTFKGLGGLVNGASKAALHRHFARDGNLAEITALSHSQQTASYMLGTALGLGLTSLQMPWICFALTSALQLWATHKAIDQVALNTVDALRFPHLVRGFLVDGKVPSPTEMISLERFHWPFASTHAVIIGASSKVLDTPGVVEEVATNSFLIYSSKDKTYYVLLHVKATELDCLEAAFQAHRLYLAGMAQPTKDFAGFCGALETAGWKIDQGISIEARRTRFDYQ